MLSEYLAGSIPQLIERGRELIAKIPRGLSRDYGVLSLTCRKKIDELIAQLEYIASSQKLLDTAYQPERLRLFKRIVSDMDTIETVGIAALNRASDDDHRLNVLLEKIKQEIKYPLETPVVTTLSQQYFCIYPELNLLCVPLTEGNFLLHLPDLYHELAHPIFANTNDPVIEPFQNQLMVAVADVLGYIAQEKNKARRRRGPDFYDLLCCWEASWIKYWLEEFFCDLFGIYTLGAAFAWSHLHLAVKRGGDPFDVPLLRQTSHPSDDARLRVMLYALETSGFQEEVKLIQEHWQTLLSQINAKPEPEYHRCYPDDLLRKIAQYARKGVEGLKCRIAIPETNDPVHSLLNQAWGEFWKNPTGYVKWEKQAVSSLFNKALST